MSMLGKNIKTLRKKAGLTQDQFAQKVSVKRAAVGAYEEGRAEPRVKTLLEICHYFKVGAEDLLNKDLSQPGIAVDMPGKHLRVLSVAVNNHSGDETIALVPVKASAGYASGYGDPDFVGELPQFNLPFSEVNRGKTNRMFQIEGDSMLPIPSRSYILAYFIQDWRSMAEGKTYVITTRDEGVLYKRLKSSFTTERGTMILSSDNPKYSDIELNFDQVAEVWQAQGFFSFDLPSAESYKPELNQMVNMMQDLQTQIEKMQTR
jgi:transcriptional regulator with XRE-family HTH domain